MNGAGTNPQFGIVARAAVLEESPLCQMVKERYESFDNGLGKKFEEGKATLEDLGWAFFKDLSDPGATRTRDPQLRRLLLYPTELRDH